MGNACTTGTSNPHRKTRARAESTELVGFVSLGTLPEVPIFREVGTTRLPPYLLGYAPG
jgi:hypothetical protein